MDAPSPPRQPPRPPSPPPPRPTLGAIIADGRDTMVEAPWIALAPGVVIAMLVLGLNLLGDGLRDALDPRQRM